MWLILTLVFRHSVMRRKISSTFQTSSSIWRVSSSSSREMLASLSTVKLFAENQKKDQFMKRKFTSPTKHTFENFKKFGWKI